MYTLEREICQGSYNTTTGEQLHPACLVVFGFTRGPGVALTKQFGMSCMDTLELGIIGFGTRPQQVHSFV